jgi:hypothetical protein
MIFVNNYPAPTPSTMAEQKRAGTAAGSGVSTDLVYDPFFAITIA